MVSLLGRLPQTGDQLKIGGYLVTITEVSNRRVLKLRFERAGDKPETDAS